MDKDLKTFLGELAELLTRYKASLYTQDDELTFTVHTNNNYPHGVDADFERCYLGSRDINSYLKEEEARIHKIREKALLLEWNSASIRTDN